MSGVLNWFGNQYRNSSNTQEVDAYTTADVRMEIIPLSNPAELNVGDYLPVKILYRGAPYDGTVYSTYEGFSTEGAYAYTIDTNERDIANIRLLDRGRWLIYARVEQDYPDPNVCDVEAFTSTLTFSIR